MLEKSNAVMGLHKDSSISSGEERGSVILRSPLTCTVDLKIRAN